MNNLELRQRFTSFRSTLHRPTKRGIFSSLLVVVIGIAAVAVYFFFFRGSAELREARRDFDRTMKAVGRLYELPAETPVLATVTDLEELKGQPFFDVAENGDKVLVFKTASKVILYRPSTKKIINFSNLNPNDLALQAQLPDQQAGADAATPTPTPTPASAVSGAPATIAIYNGTNISGLTQKVQQQLRTAVVEGEVVLRENAVSRTYTETIVIALTPNGEVVLSSIEEALGANRGTLPEGEESPSGADVLIIAGQDSAGT